MKTNARTLCLGLMALMLVTAGCQSGGANCCVNWDFYKECDLIGGRSTRDCCGQTVVTTCDPIPCKPGIVLTRTIAIPAESAPVGEVIEFEEIAVDPAPPSDE